MNNILIVSNCFLVEESLGQLFNNLFTYSVVKTISDIYDIDEEELANQDLIFAIINENDGHILEKLGKIKVINKKVKILILDTQRCEAYFKKAIQMDIDGYMTNITEKEEFVFVVNRIAQGKKAYDAILLKSVASTKYINRGDVLTRREKDVLKELGKGLSNKEISSNLYITEHTVKKHISSILDKLNLKNRQEAILYIKQEQ